MITKVLDESKGYYHCYQLTEDKNYRVTIRFLHPTMNVEVFKTKLNDKVLEHGSATFCCKRPNILRGDFTRTALRSHVITL